MITNISQFQKGKYKLPNSIAAPNGADYTELIAEYIEDCERDVLIDSLGVNLYDILENENYPLQEDSETRIKNLVNGCNYEKNNLTIRWEGLEQMLVPYIYYKFVNDQQNELTTFGMERPEGVNSEAVSANNKIVDAYQDFIKKYQGVNSNPRVIRRSVGYGIDWYGSRSSVASLYQFLTENIEDYPEVSNFKFKETINSFGI